MALGVLAHAVGLTSSTTVMVYGLTVAETPDVQQVVQPCCVIRTVNLFRFLRISATTLGKPTKPAALAAGLFGYTQQGA